jgi:hypothetical protein
MRLAQDDVDRCRRLYELLASGGIDPKAAATAAAAAAAAGATSTAPPAPGPGAKIPLEV